MNQFENGRETERIITRGKVDTLIAIIDGSIEACDNCIATYREIDDKQNELRQESVKLAYESIKHYVNSLFK